MRSPALLIRQQHRRVGPPRDAHLISTARSWITYSYIYTVQYSTNECTASPAADLAAWGNGSFNLGDAGLSATVEATGVGITVHLG